MLILSDCERMLGNGSGAGDSFFVRFYIDDGILVEVHFFHDGRRLRHAIVPCVGPFLIARPPRSTGCLLEHSQNVRL